MLSNQHLLEHTQQDMDVDVGHAHMHEQDLELLGQADRIKGDRLQLISDVAMPPLNAQLARIESPPRGSTELIPTPQPNPVRRLVYHPPPPPPNVQQVDGAAVCFFLFFSSECARNNKNTASQARPYFDFSASLNCAASSSNCSIHQVVNEWHSVHPWMPLQRANVEPKIWMARRASLDFWHK